MNSSDFPAVFRQLRAILEPFADRYTVTADTADRYALDTPYSERWKKELLFGKTEIGKRYVSFHLFPVYMYPDLLDGISDELRARMQGKSCFNFTRSNPELFEELAALTRAGQERLEHEGVVGPARDEDAG